MMLLEGVVARLVVKNDVVDDRHAENTRRFNKPIWRNAGKSGAFHNATLTRRYKEGEDWKNTDSLGKYDLLKAARLCIQAYSWIDYYEQHGTEEPEQID